MPATVATAPITAVTVMTSIGNAASRTPVSRARSQGRMPICSFQERSASRAPIIAMVAAGSA